MDLQISIMELQLLVDTVALITGNSFKAVWRIYESMQ